MIRQHTCAALGTFTEQPPHVKTVLVNLEVLDAPLRFVKVTDASTCAWMGEPVVAAEALTQGFLDSVLPQLPPDIMLPAPIEDSLWITPSRHACDGS